MPTHHARLLLALLVIGFMAGGLQGQSESPMAPPLDGPARQRAIDDTAVLLTERYIFPDVAERCVAHVRERLDAGAYDELDSAFDFARVVTQDLQSVSGDRHLNLRPMPPVVADAPPPSDPETRHRQHIERGRRENFGFRRVEIMPGNIGYVDLRGFFDPFFGGDTAVATMNFLANADAIIFDLRQNGGGHPGMIQLITSYLFNGSVHLNSFERRGQEQIDQTWTLPHVPGPRLPGTPVYVLTSGYTFSAAEEFTYNLKNLERATIVGQTTGGGAHPGGSHPVAERFFLFVPNGRAINPVTGTNWEGTGVAPDIEVPTPDALSAARIDALENLAAEATDLDAAARYRWILEGLAAEMHPYTATEEELRSVVGRYGERVVTFADGALTYQRGTMPPYALVAMAKDVFRLEGIDVVRIHVVRDAAGDVERLVAKYEDGRRDEFVRDE